MTITTPTFPTLLVLPITTEAEAFAFLGALVAAGRVYHLEDDPADISGPDGITFPGRVADMVRKRIGEIYALPVWSGNRCPIAYTMSVEVAKQESDLVDEFALWTMSQGFETGDAMDLLHRDDITAEQRKWLSDFVVRWEAMEEQRSQWGNFK